MLIIPHDRKTPHPMRLVVLIGLTALVVLVAVA